MNSATFQIYNASAGSGKTFTLVKEYLKILIKSPYHDAYKNSLAITFTNKAVAEMKIRIISNLKEFSKKSILSEPTQMFNDICLELDLKPEKVRVKAAKILDSIIYNYAAFDISTIDKFTQKLIRTFAYDLHLPLNFEVELDTDNLLNKAVNNLIAKAGSDKALTKTLIDFAIEKADDDRSWDVSIDFLKISKLLINENDILFLETIKDKSLSDFDALKTNVVKKIKTYEKELVVIATATLSFIDECGLEHSDFMRSSLPNFFKKIQAKQFNQKLDSNWQLEIASKPLYPKKTSPDAASTIDSIQPELADNFNKTKEIIYKYLLLKSIYKNITPLSVLNNIHKEVQAIKDEQNLVLISEFNSIISSHIKEQPAPFIYERIGEKFDHYFIDEFQDTSEMQWQNLIPLLDNTLSSENGSTLIVGDAKQAIYRWRGGKAEQFIDLFTDENPFHVPKKVINLPANFRSYKTVVEFNNAFFKHLSEFVFRDQSYKNLYEQSHQEINQKNEGYVSVSFLDIPKDEDLKQAYAHQTLKTIQSCIENGFSLSDICILVRYGKDGVVISEYLNEHEIDIISSETLLIKNAPEIQFIINLLEFISEPNNGLAKVEALDYLAVHRLELKDKHTFFASFIDTTLHSFFEQLENFGFYFNVNEFIALPFYEAIELIIQSFYLAPESNAYIQFFLDFILDFSEKSNTTINTFLEHFELKKDKLSIISPEGKNAVQVMTIHKSKGLEFPIVIFPFADLDIYYNRNDKVWFPLNPEENNGFEQTLIPFNNDVENYGENGRHIFNRIKAEKELDNINLLYVALTRAEQQLHIISKKESKVNLGKYNGLLINYLNSIGDWDDSKTYYEFGNPKNTSTVKAKTRSQQLEHFISTPKKEHNLNIVTASGYLWDTHQQEAIEKGNLIHLILSKINSVHDIPFVFKEFIDSGQISEEQETLLKPLVFKVIEHDKLKHYYTTEVNSYNEREILSKSGKKIIPDKLVILPNNEVILIDYKTGTHNKKYIEQLESYQKTIEEMKLKVVKKILVYINDEIEIKVI